MPFYRLIKIEDGAETMLLETRSDREAKTEYQVKWFENFANDESGKDYSRAQSTAGFKEMVKVYTQMITDGECDPMPIYRLDVLPDFEAGQTITKYSALKKLIGKMVEFSLVERTYENGKRGYRAQEDSRYKGRLSVTFDYHTGAPEYFVSRPHHIDEDIEGHFDEEIRPDDLAARNLVVVEPKE